MAQAQSHKFGLPEDLDVLSEKSRDLMNRAQICAQFEEAVIACENANRMYAKSLEQVRKCDARMTEVSRRFARAVGPFRIGSEQRVLYSEDERSRATSPRKVKVENVENLIARADTTVRDGHAVGAEFKETRINFEQRRREFNRSHHASTPKPRKRD